MIKRLAPILFMFVAAIDVVDAVIYGNRGLGGAAAAFGVAAGIWFCLAVRAALDD